MALATPTATACTDSSYMVIHYISMQKKIHFNCKSVKFNSNNTNSTEPVSVLLVISPILIKTAPLLIAMEAVGNVKKTYQINIPTIS